MKIKKRDKLFFLLALNVITPLATVEGSSEKLYNGLVKKNIEEGKASDSIYKLLERILFKKNKELKDLYFQGDYIIKPEYLEWQIFFSAFYNNAEKKGSDKSADIEDLREERSINFGFNLADKVLDKTINDLNIESKTEKLPPFAIPDIKIANIEIEPINFNLILPLSEVSFNYSSVSNEINKDLFSSKGEIADLDQINGYFENNVNRSYDGVNGSTKQAGKLMTLFNMETGKIVNNVNIEMDDTDTSSFGKHFIGVCADNTNKYLNVENNGTVSILRGSKIVGIGFLDGVASENPEELTTLMFTSDPQKVILSDGTESQGAYIQNYGTVEMSGIFSSNISSWVNFSGKSLDYISHLPGKEVGNILIGESVGLYLSLENKTASDKLRIDPGVIVEKGHGIGMLIDINGNNDKGEVHILNLNNNSKYGDFNIDSGDRTKDSQIILIPEVLTQGYSDGIRQLNNTFNTKAKVYIETPIYIAKSGSKGFNIMNLSQDIETIMESDIKIMYLPNSNYTINSRFGSIIYGDNPYEYSALGIKLFGGTLLNKGNITNILDESYDIELNNGEQYNLKGNPNGIDYTIGISVEGGKFIQEGGSIKIGGASFGIFKTGGDLVLKNVLFETKAGTIGIVVGGVDGASKFVDSNFKIGSSSTFLYGVFDSALTRSIEFEGENTAEIGEKSLGILAANNDSNFDYNILKNLKNIKFTLKPYATLFSVFDSGISMSLKSSDLLSLENFNIDPASSDKSFTLNVLSLINSDFHVDQNVNLDENVSLLKRFNSRGMDVILDPGITISGSEDGVQAIRGTVLDITAYAPSFPISQTNIDNQGTINLTGNKSFGTIIDYGTTKNSSFGIISVTGSESVGMYGENSSRLTNEGNILVGSNSLGIYARSYTDPINHQTYGTGTIEVINEGNITALESEGSVGIYLDNNKVSGTVLDSILSLNGQIDVSKSERGLGVYVNKTTVTNNSPLNITVGKLGIGLYAKDSDINLTNLSLNLHGDNALGLYLEGNTNFTGSGNINVDGKGVILFNLNSTGIFTNNLTVTSTPYSSYVVSMSNNTQVQNTGIINLDTNGIGILGRNTAVLLDNTSVINGTGPNVTGIAMKGHGIINPSWNTTSDITNRGNINLTDDSLGVYGEDDVYVLNDTTGVIKIGVNGTGVYVSGNDSSIENKGQVEIGENSHGIFLKDSNLYVKNSGIIKGNGPNTVGIFTNGGSAETLNEGEINLSGDKAAGIYSINSGNIENSGEILIGNSIQRDNPGIGIYSTNNIVDNIGIISVGENSLGIYNSGGTINQNGTLTIGSEGTGIYASGGTVNLGTSSILNLSSGNTSGVYVKLGSNLINNGTINTETGNVVFVVEDNSSVLNNNEITLKGDSVFIYSLNNGIIENSQGANVEMQASNNIGIYSKNGGSILNKGNISGVTGISNVGIYNNLGSIENYGVIKVGDSLIIDKNNPEMNAYSVGIYGIQNTSLNNYGDIEVGESGIGIYAVDGNTMFLNKGNIVSDKNDAVGIYLENSMLQNEGNVILSGKNSIGIAITKGSTLTNSGNITVNGENNIGILGSVNSKIINYGKIYVNGNDSIGIQLENGSTLENSGEIILANGLIGSKDIEKSGYILPSIINAGIIKVDEKFEINGLDLTIKVDPKSVRIPTIEEITMENYDIEDLSGGFLLSNAVSIKAPNFDLNGNTIKIDPSYTQGTNARVYKFENVFDPTTAGGVNSGEISMKSGSLTFEAIPNINSKGKVDIWMQKINYSEFTKGSWQNQFSENIEKKYLNATGDVLKIYDKIDLITEVNELNERFSELAGSIYANMNQREQTIADIFEDSLGIIQNSENKTKENVKVNIISGKGKIEDKTKGVTGYDYTSTGVQLLREVERTYKQTFGYSFGYLHTDFEYMNNNDTEEKVDTIQLGLHNKYNTNNWVLKNDLTGRVSFHDMERKINWINSEKSEMRAKYRNYSITSDNKFGREIKVGKRTEVLPYGGLKLMYGVRPTFKEKGLESLELEGNDAWSIKPKVGVELKGSLPLRTNWQLKGSLDVSYEYELGDINEREHAKLTALEDSYHKLSKPEEEKGTFKTKASVGVEVEDRYGVFLTGEYKIGESNHDNGDYRAGVMLKAVF